MALAASKDWRAAVGTNHTPPLGKPWVYVVALEMANQGCPRGGALLVAQYHHCLRPSEGLGLRPSSVLFPEMAFHQRHGLLMLGRKSGTKAGRPQGVKSEHPIAIALLRRLVETADSDAPLAGLSLSQYHTRLKHAMVATGLDAINWSPHSPRAGYASDAVSEGIAFDALREFGRWQHDQSLRTYLDIVLVAGGEIANQLRSRLLQARHIEANFLSMFLQAARMPRQPSAPRSRRRRRPAPAG